MMAETTGPIDRGQRAVSVSVVVPVYNGAALIADCIRALLAQRIDAPYEIIVVDDGSTDETSAVVDSLSADEPRIRALRLGCNQGRSRARNCGIEEARGRIVVFTDADCIPAPDWLQNMIEPFTDPHVAGVGGAYRTLNKDRWMARYVGYEIAERHERMARLPRVDHIGTYSAAYRREALQEAGAFVERGEAAFDTDMEDTELSYRLTERGYSLVFRPAAWVYHRHVDSLSKYLRQQFQRGFWRVYLMRAQPGRIARGDSYAGFSAQVQALLSISVLVSTPFWLSARWRWVSGSALLLLVLSNVKVGLFAGHREKRFLVIAPFLASLRSLAATSGAVYAGMAALHHAISRWFARPALGKG
jgi:cellulose synthase/poly-beta-1,6-N-acetylglucosamine synthase-like glycosyltransferase